MTPPTPARADGTPADLRVAGLLLVGLAALGALLGFVWSAWSGPQQRAYVIAPGRLYPYDEVETMAAADGRYFVIVAALGVVAGFLAWFALPRNRGALVLLGLIGGGLAGSALTWWVGYLSDGGSYRGKPGTTIPHLPLTLHMPALLVFEPAIGCLIYGLFVAFTARDDLGHADPVRDRVLVAARSEPQYGWGDGDRSGALEQRDLPTQ